MPNSSSTARSADGASARSGASSSDGAGAGADASAGVGACADDCCSSGSPSPGAGPVELSAKKLHALAVRAFRTGNRGRLSLCESLRILSETRLFLELGFPTIAAYADTFFQLRRSEAYEYVRVAHALVELTELRDAFGQGQLAWSVLKAVTRVASAETQTTWIDFARKNGAERTLAEARDALQRRRDKPRDSSFGLPNLDQKLVLRFARSDMEKMRGWIEMACETVAEKTGTNGVSVEQALLFLCEQSVASNAPAAGTADRANRDVSCAPHRAQIVYQRCPDCRRARMGTREGFVEVVSDEVERYEGCADPVVIDGPTTPGSPGRPREVPEAGSGTPPKMRRQILGREAGRCANPRCGHRAAHCHHIEFQANGGKTCLANEVALCTTCHALIHAGLLRLAGDANGEMEWSPVAVEGSLKRRAAADAEVADSLPVMTFQTGSRNGNNRSPGHSGSSATADSRHASASGNENGQSATADSRQGSAGDHGAAVALHGVDLEALTHGLVRLGVPAARSRQILGAVIAAQPPGQVTEASVLRSALAAI